MNRAPAGSSSDELPRKEDGEWQAAARGTPDGAPCVVLTAGPGATGTPGCVSDVGAFDMVGNLGEGVADWVPASTACVTDLFGRGDVNCLAGASTELGPGALTRGGHWTSGTFAGVFAISGSLLTTSSQVALGFRPAR